MNDLGQEWENGVTPPRADATFAERVYAVVASIPTGRVTTYGLIARALGAPRSARAVGWSLRHTPSDVHIPAHRVVNRLGVLTGAPHFGHPEAMRDRLVAEGIPFRDEDAFQVDIARVVWDPADEASLDWVFQFGPDGPIEF